MASRKGGDTSDGQNLEIGIFEQENSSAILPRHGIFPTSPTTPSAEQKLKRRRAISLEDNSPPQGPALETSNSVEFDSEGFEIYEQPEADTPATVEIFNISDTETPPTPKSARFQCQINPQQPIYSLPIPMEPSSTVPTNTWSPSSSISVCHTVMNDTGAGSQGQVIVSSQKVETVSAAGANDEPCLSRVEHRGESMEYQVIDDREVQVRRNRFLRLRENRFLRPKEASDKHVKEVIRSPPKKPRSAPLHNHGDRSAKKIRKAFESRQEDSDKENWDPDDVV